MANKPIIAYILDNLEATLQKDFMQELFMIPDRMVATRQLDDPDEAGHPQFILQTNGYLYQGKLFVFGDSFYSVLLYERVDDRTTEHVSYQVSAIKTDIAYQEGENAPLITAQDPCVIEPGQIANYHGDGPMETKIGRVITNYLLLVYPFGDVIPYINAEFKYGNLSDILGKAVMDGTITVADYKGKYVDTLYLMYQSTELNCPGITEKTITIPKEIHTLRNTLVSQNKEALDRGDPTTMTTIEQALIKVYKDHLKGDPSLHFLLKKKYFNVTLKKLFLAQGMTERADVPGTFAFIDQPMGSGWKIKDLPLIFNEVRIGSASRALETAKGGEQTKMILRMLQDTRINMMDCQTTEGLLVTPDESSYKEFIWVYMVVGKTVTLIDDDNIKSIIGKQINMRSPAYCKAPLGYCARCFGKTFELLGQKAFAPVANNLAAQITASALKKMHGVSHSVVDVSNLDEFLMDD